MKGKVESVAEEIIKMTPVGHQTKESIEDMAARANAISSKLLDASRPVKVMVDMSQMGGASLGARIAVSDIYKRLEISQLAIFGASPLQRAGSKWVMRASGMTDRVRYFENEAAALNWLR